jgi:chaperone required for assembly of F1-ATPase
MRRFWTEVAVDGGALRLDNRPVRTPGRAELALPTPALAQAIAAEWRAVEGELNPRAMPLTGLANAAIDRVAPAAGAFAAGLARYAASDLLCYRADAPAELVARQAARWDPVVAWAEGRYDVHLSVAAGVMPQAQPPLTLRRLEAAVGALDAWRLAGLSPVVTVTGSLLLALALLDGAIDAQTGWAAAQVDEEWQAERWGEDMLAADARDARRRDYDAGLRFLELLAA